MAKKKPAAADAKPIEGASPKKPRAKKVIENIIEPEQFATNAMDYPEPDECPDCKMHQSLCKCSNRQIDIPIPTLTIKGVPLIWNPAETEDATGKGLAAPSDPAPTINSKQVLSAKNSKRENNQDTEGNHGTVREGSTQLGTQEQSQNQGDVPISVAETAADYSADNLPREESQAEATRRWRNSGIAEQVAVFRDRVREEYRVANPGCKRRDAHDHAWERAMAQFPPPGVAPVITEIPEKTEPEPEKVSPIGDKVEPVDQGVSGLGDMPESWGQLPANAQLQVEIAWVSANRLRVRSGNGVDLSRALSPAPSYSALSWLETSILFPSKFADISVKATAQQDDEREGIRREKLAIEEIRGLLAEMLE